MADKVVTGGGFMLMELDFQIMKILKDLRNGLKIIKI